MSLEETTGSQQNSDEGTCTPEDTQSGQEGWTAWQGKDQRQERWLGERHCGNGEATDRPRTRRGEKEKMLPGLNIL